MSATLAGVALLVVGLALCFAGYRLFRIILIIWGLLTGFQIGVSLAAQLFGAKAASGTLELICGAVGAVILALISYLLFEWQVVLAGALVGYFLGSAIATALHVTPGWGVILVGLAGAVIIGALVLVLNLPKLIIILSTSLVGSAAIVAGLLLLLSLIALTDLQSGITGPIAHVSWFWTALWLALVVVGILIQWNTTQARPAPPQVPTTYEP